jgi:hypothetical protein
MEMQLRDYQQMAHHQGTNQVIALLLIFSFSSAASAHRPVRFAYQPPASSTFLSQQTSHQQSANSTFLSEQISTSHQPPAKRTGCKSLAGGRAG